MDESTCSTKTSTMPTTSATDDSHSSDAKKSGALDADTNINANNILLFLVAFRIANALSLRTFFQPDEFFQSLEPAWDIAFGKGSGAWITWEWRHHLRSSIHPYIFAGVYHLADIISRALSLAPLSRADLLVAAPKVTQAIFAALGDHYTWKLARKVYGAGSNETWAALALTVLSPWQWFCSTRTLSNCLETTLTVVALYLWPWNWSSKGTQKNRSSSIDLLRLRICLLFAAFACILRPTNLMVWACLAAFVLLNNPSSNKKTAVNVYLPLIRETLICGSTVLVVSLLADRVYFKEWTLPPLKFLYFNLAQSLAVFYGRNDWHYYLSQGYPLLLTTALPFALIGLYNALSSRPNENAAYRRDLSRQLAVVSTFMPFVLSLISHKEVRFIYPLLPVLHVLAAPSLAHFFSPAITSSSTAYMPRRLTLIFLILVNLVVAYYLSVVHASGTVNVLEYLREQKDQKDQVSETVVSQGFFSSPSVTTSDERRMTVGFLMPCHSTPWRSHLVFPTIDAWALACEPPVNFNATQKAAYVDEADQFYDNPAAFLQKNMIGGTRHTPGRPSWQTHPLPNTPADPDPNKHSWPDYLVFFAQLEPLLQSELRSSAYAECYRTWNTAWHDDWRRKGDIVVWCLDASSQRDWQMQKNGDQQSNKLSPTHQNPMLQRRASFDKIIEAVRREAGVGWEETKKKSKWHFPTFLLKKWQGTNSRPLSWPFGTKKQTYWVSWLDGTPHLGRGSPWSWSWPWEQEKRPWWRTWMSSVTDYWQNGGSEESDDRERNLWS